MTNLDINDNNFLRQFEVNIGGQLAKVEYALQERKIFLTKIILPENTSDEFQKHEEGLTFGCRTLRVHQRSKIASREIQRTRTGKHIE